MVSFRAPTRADALAIAKLHAKSWQEHYRGAFSDAFLDNEAPSERRKVWNDRLQNPSSNQFIRIAEVDSSLVGFVCAYFDDCPTYGTLLDNLHVVSDRKGRGIGSQLVGLVAKEIGTKYPNTGMYLWVLEQNHDANRFYRALGGEKVETVNGADIGNQIVLKSRYFWPSMSILLNKVIAK